MKLLIIDDEQDIVDVLKPALSAEGFVVDYANDGETGLQMCLTQKYDLMIIDNMLPNMDGQAVCRAVRRLRMETPILILSVIANSDKKTELLDAGADDYLTKPFSLKELSARVRALLRRPHHLEHDVIQIDDLRLDPKKHLVTRGDREIRLAPKEFGLLAFLMRNAGVAISRSMLMENVWDMNADLFTNTIETHINSLRRKLSVPGKPDLIQTVHGLGYKMELVSPDDHETKE